MISDTGLARLADLRVEMLRMARYVQNAYSKSSIAILGRNEHQARDVVHSTAVINQYQIELERTIIILTGILTPIGKDLRFLTMSMNIINILQRIGGKCEFTCKKAIELIRKPPIGYYERMRTILGGVAQILKGSIDNLIDPSLDQAQRLCSSDSEIDRMFEETLIEIVRNIEQAPTVTSRAIDLIMILESLEEIADMATELMEASVFVELGKHYRCTDDVFKPVDFKAY